MEKKCTKCDEIKCVDEFVRHKRYKDGRYSQCKACTRVLEKEWRSKNQPIKREIRKRYREKNKEKIRDQDRTSYRLNPDKFRDKAKASQAKYFRSEKGRRKYLEQSKKLCLRYPEKVKARCLLSHAITSGKVVKPKTCSNCLKEKSMIHGHHEDYSKPYEVKWLCIPCHFLEHRKLTVTD